MIPSRTHRQQKPRLSKSDNARKKAYENPLQALSKHCPVFYVTNSLHVPYLIKRDSMKNKMTNIKNRSRRRSYGKKGTRRQLTQRKQHAIEPARVREAKPIENVTPTETKIPWRAPRSKPDPGTYACRTITGGCGVSFFLLASFILSSLEDGWISLFFFMIALLVLILTLQDFSKSRGGW
jgi:hypothetical protein